MTPVQLICLAATVLITVVSILLLKRSAVISAVTFVTGTLVIMVFMTAFKGTLPF